MEEKPVNTVALESGMKLNFYDVSKKMGKDRWLVSLLIRMDIPVNETVLNRPEPSDPPTDDINKVLGRSFSFEQKIERVFVADDEKEALFKQFCDSILTGSLAYFSHPAFAKNFIIKKYNELKKIKIVSDAREELNSC